MKEDLILIDLTRIVKDMLYLCIERMFGLTNGCRILERICCRLSPMLLTRSTREVGGSFKRKRGLTLCYNCRRPRHIAKEFHGRRHSCLCFKAIDHEVLDCPRMIAKLEGMNLNQEKPKADPKIAESQRESEKVLLQMKETLNDHRHVRLFDIFKEKEYIKARIGDFNIDCVMDEETPVNIMTERTWEAIGRPSMIPSLGGVGLFRGKLVNLCGKLTQISMNANGTST
jgi:hypothetical protein